jgi:bilirubin oxidase
LIGTDGGLLSAPLSNTRYRIAPGQRADILVDLSTSLGQNFQLMSYGSELPNAIYGASQPGMGAGATGSLVGYTSNPLNGNDFELLDITVAAQTANPILTIPATLASFTPIPEASANITRDLLFTTSGPMGDLTGPFLINGSSFDMGTINYTVPLDNIEIWSLTNQTPIAHPFHIHDVQFFILDINGSPPPPELQGYNDVVLVPAGMGTVRFIAKFNDFANDTIPFMYHCHMLTHEDMGMMGQFIVSDPNASSIENSFNDFTIYPNPFTDEFITLEFNQAAERQISVTDVTGKLIKELTTSSEAYQLDLTEVKSGVYRLTIESNGSSISKRIIKQ